MSRSPYLHDIPLDQAVSLFHDRLHSHGLFGILGIEEIPLDEHAAGRVLAEPLIARRCSPHYHASAMDGFALRSQDTQTALPSNPVSLRVETQVAFVDTGDPLPEWADAVIPIENVESLNETGDLCSPAELRSPFAIRIRASVQPWSNVRPVGEDLIVGQLILASGDRLRPVDLGAAAAGGVTQLRVSRRPRVGILPTGDELVPLQKDPIRGEISEFNSIVLAGQVTEWGGRATRYPICKDKLEALSESVLKAARENDLVLVNAGSSAGREDFTCQVLEQLGEVIVHGIAVRPGHPVIIGFVQADQGGVARYVPVIGVPGYPVSAALTVEILVKPLIKRWLGEMTLENPEIHAQLTRKITSPAGDDDYIRVILGRVNGNLLAAPIARGAGVTTSLSKADGIMVLPRMIQGMDAGDMVSVRLFRDPSILEKNILSIGSHDLTLDILAQNLALKDRRLVSSNAGSLGGLLALKRDQNHFAGSHLLDPQTGTYNTVEIQRIFPGQKMYALRWVNREQGLLIKKGNSKSIRSIQDLARQDVRMINRQRGAGTRVLLDYLLDQEGVNPEMIHGYDREEFTHLGVAVAIASGRADVGLGVYAAAEAMDLDFIYLCDEEYELIFTEQGLQDPLLAPVFDLSREPQFKDQVARLAGYNLVHMGEVRTINPGNG